MRRRSSPSSKRRGACSPTGSALPRRSAGVPSQRTVCSPTRRAPCSRKPTLRRSPDMLDLDALDFAKGGGLVTVVTQDVDTGAVLMVAHADREALEHTLATGEMHYRSRTRGLWHKGATSGNVQQVVALLPDCDGDAILARVRSPGPACHTGARSCFGVPALAADALGTLDATIAARVTEALPTASAE